MKGDEAEDASLASVLDDTDSDDGLGDEESWLAHHTHTLSQDFSTADGESHRTASPDAPVAAEDVTKQCAEPQTCSTPAHEKSLRRSGRSQSLRDVLRYHVRQPPDFSPIVSVDDLRPNALGKTYSGIAPLNLVAGAAQLREDVSGSPALVAETYRDLPCGSGLEVIVRPDKPADNILNAVVRVASRHGLKLRRKHAMQVLHDTPPAAPAPRRRQRRHLPNADTSSPVAAAAPAVDWEIWTHVDAQLVIRRDTKHRVLLVRVVASAAALLKAAETVQVPAASVPEGATVGYVSSNEAGDSASEIRRNVIQFVPLGIAASNFLDELRLTLVEDALVMGALLDMAAGENQVHIDPPFVRQVQAMCREEMLLSLRQASRTLESHAREAQEQSLHVANLLEPMFETFGVDMPQPELGSPHDVGAASSLLPATGAQQSPPPELGFDDTEELRQMTFPTEAARVMAFVLLRWCRCVAREDAVLTSKMQRKNIEVLNRIGRAKLYERLLFQSLRDDHQAVLTSRLATTFHRELAGARCGIDPNLEGPMFYCGIMCGGRTGTLYITYWHLCLGLRVIPQVGKAKFKVIPLKEITALKRTRSFVGEALTVKRKEDEVSFVPTVVRTVELYHLLTCLVRVHVEPMDAVIVGLKQPENDI